MNRPRRVMAHGHSDPGTGPSQVKQRERESVTGSSVVMQRRSEVAVGFRVVMQPHNRANRGTILASLLYVREKPVHSADVS